MLLTKVMSQIHKRISLLQHMWISSSINLFGCFLARQCHSGKFGSKC